MTSLNNTPVANDEISLKDLIKSIQSLYSLLLNKIIIIAVVGLIGSCIGFYFAFSKRLFYKAELRFVVKSEGTNSGLSGMLGGLGAALGGTQTSPLERTVEIAASDRIVGAALLTPVEIKGQGDILANYLIKFNGLNKAWKKDTTLNGVSFSATDSSIDKMSYARRKAIKLLEAILIPKVGTGIISKSYDKKSGIVKLSAVHHNEEFSIVLVKEIFNKLRDFYVEQTITSAANNVVILQKKVDSIKTELSKIQSLYARTTDQSFGLIFQEDKVDLRKLAVREQMLTVMYAEAQKNLETFKFMNDSAIPTLTVIDMPYSPLGVIRRSKILFTLGGFFLGAFLCFGFIVTRRWYRKVMAS
jgi:hypothetical protein